MKAKDTPGQIPIRLITISKLNPRADATDDPTGLTEDIKDIGLTHRISIRKCRGKKGRYEVIVGSQRFRSLKKVRGKSGAIKAEEYEIVDWDDETCIRKVLSENDKRSDVSPYALGKYYVTLMKREGCKTQRALAKRFKLSEDKVQSLISLVKGFDALPKTWQEDLKKGADSVSTRKRITAEHARRALPTAESLAKAGDKDGQEQFDHMLGNLRENGASTQQVTSETNAFKRQRGEVRAQWKLKAAQSHKAGGKSKAKPQKSNMFVLARDTWNPFIGCRHGCVFCEGSFQYTTGLGNPDCGDCKEYVPHVHEDELAKELPATGYMEFVFACGSGDIAHCPPTYLDRIIKRIKGMPDRTFLLQSKNPIVFRNLALPPNVIAGTTLETNRDTKYELVAPGAPKPSARYKEFLKVKHPVRMVTIEPALDFDVDKMVQWIKKINPRLVWLGYQTGNRRLKVPAPSREKFYALHRELSVLGFVVLLKSTTPPKYAVKT